MADGIPNFDQLHAINLFNYLPRAAGVIPQGRGSLVANPAPAQVVAPAPVQVAAPAVQDPRAGFAANILNYLPKAGDVTPQGRGALADSVNRPSPPGVETMAGNFLNQPAFVQAQKSYAAGDIPGAAGGALSALVSDIGDSWRPVKDAAKAVIIAPAKAGMAFRAGFNGSPSPVAPAAKAVAPAMDAIETSDPRAPEAPPDSLGVRNFKTLARITSGMTRNQLAEYVRNYPRAPLIDPKTAAAGSLLESLKTTFEQKKNALAQIDTSTAAGKKAQADGFINAQLDFQKGLISMTQPTITPFVGGAGLTDPSNPSN